MTRADCGGSTLEKFEVVPKIHANEKRIVDVENGEMNVGNLLRRLQ